VSRTKKMTELAVSAAQVVQRAHAKFELLSICFYVALSWSGQTSTGVSKSPQYISLAKGGGKSRWYVISGGNVRHS